MKGIIGTYNDSKSNITNNKYKHDKTRKLSPFYLIFIKYPVNMTKKLNIKHTSFLGIFIVKEYIKK